MTAAELHAIVKPLWEVAPETRPMVEWYDGGGNAEYAAWYIVETHRIADDPYCRDACSVDVAAALCEVAVMRFIRNTPTSIGGRDLHPKLSDDDPTYVFVWLCWPPHWPKDGLDIDDHSAMFKGETLLHALVAAALAVVKGEG